MAWLLVLWGFGLILAGGLVTTYRVGMAVPDWPTTFERNMFTYPLDEMLENQGVAIEHSHRLIASGLGLIAILAVVVAAFSRKRTAILMSIAVLVAISAQGILGGFRVLENDPQLAFLHGASAQVVYGLIAAFVVVTSARWQTAERRPCKQARGLQRIALIAVVAVYAQIVLGAWLRHSGLMLALIAHILMAVVALGAVLGLAKKLEQTAAEGAAGGHDRSVLSSVRRFILGVVFLQVLLGLGATFAIFELSGGFDGRPVMAEVVSATLHVGVGALLLAGCVAALLWSRRLVSTGELAGQVCAEGAS